MHLHGGAWGSEPLGYDGTIAVYLAAVHIRAVLIWSAR